MKLFPFLLGTLVNSKSIRDSPSDTKVIHGKGTERKLSEQAQENTADYDHEAFFGGNVDLMEELREMGEVEVKRRLETLCRNSIDRNGDDLVTLPEIAEWIRYQQVRYVHEDTQRVWLEHAKANPDWLTWNEYVEQSYSGVQDWDTLDQNGHTFQQNVNRDRRKWDEAKSKENKAIDIEDFAAFLHPEHFPRMHEIYVQELFEDIDTNQDNRISKEEYIKDLLDDGDTDDFWVENEKKNFDDHRDADKNGFLDFGEVKEWIVPNELDHAKLEAERLIELVLTEKNETSDRKYIHCADLATFHDIFLDSSITDWGEHILRHEEF